MKETEAKRFATEWHTLHTNRQQVDHAIAKLAFEIRAATATDADAIAFIIERIGATSKRAREALVEAQAWDAVRSVEHWRAIGGLKSAKVIAPLTKKQRLVVLAEAVAAADKLGRPIGATKVRDIAWRHGFTEPKEPRGVTATKQNAELIADLRRLVNSGVVQLAQLSASVRAIVKPSAKGRMVV